MLPCHTMAAFEAALETVAKEICKHGYQIKSKDREHFKKIIKPISVQPQESSYTIIERCIFENNTDEPQMTTRQIAEVKRKTNEVKIGIWGIGRIVHAVGDLIVDGKYENLTKDESEKKWNADKRMVPPKTCITLQKTRLTMTSLVKFSCQANFVIRVYSLTPLKSGTTAGASVGAAVGVTGGAASGIGVGLGSAMLLGTAATFAIPIPVIGTLVGIAAGVAVGLGTAAIGTGAGAGIGAAVTHGTVKRITAEEVFKTLPGKYSKCAETNTVYCEMTAQTEEELYQEKFETLRHSAPPYT